MPLVERYSCGNCENNCCDTFEICVSCCLNPDNSFIIEDRLINYLYENENSTNNAETFEFCTALCRTFSNSINPDHSFTNPERKYCFGVVQ